MSIRVGASIDASVATAFSQLEKAAVRAASQIRKQMGDASVDAARSAAAAATKSAGPYRQTGNDAEKAAARAKKAVQDTAAALGGMASGAQAKFKSLSDGLRRLPVDLQTVAREASRAMKQIEREKARESLGIGSSRSLYWSPGGGNFKIKKPVLHTLDMDPVRGASKFGMGAVSFAAHAAMGVARAAGVETDWQAIMAKNFSEQVTATQISNSGYMPGQVGPNGKIVSSQSILGDARKTAIDTGNSRGDILEGMQAFVGKTGDLQLARDIMSQLATLSSATGSNFSEMVSAGAEVANVLGDIPNKAKVTESIMRQIAGQGKLGAVEVRDLATQMAKIASQATKFQGGAAENIALLGVVAQEAKARGGATNAAQATTAVARFTEEFSKPTVLKHLMGGKRLGFLKTDLNPYADAGNTQLKKAPDLIKTILSATGGDLTKLSAVMPSTIAQKAIGGFAQVYNETSGSDADKIRAVTAEFDRLHDAQLSQEEVSRAFGETMAQAKAKAAGFNERMAAVVERMQTALVPALEKMTPALLSFADHLGKIVESPAFSKAVGGTENVLSLFGLGDGSNRQDEASRAAALAGTNAGTTISRTNRWMQTNLLANAEEIVDPAKNLAAAEPVLSPLRTQEAQVKEQIAALQKNLADERPHYFGGVGGAMSDTDIKKAAAGGDASAERFMNDKTMMEGLNDTLKKLQSERSNLERILTSGAVVVRIDGAPATPGSGGPGAQEPNSSHE